MYLALKVFIALLSFTTNVYSLKPKAVNITKCCKFEEYLSIANRTCLQNPSISWNITIYNIRRGKFEDHTDLPPNWKVKDGVMPACSKPQLLLFQGKSNVPFMNGSVFSAEFDQIFHPDEFCLDHHAILVCINEPENLTKIKKCCGEQAIFSQTNATCRRFKDDSYRIDVGENKTLSAGFPVCVENKMHVVGELRNSTLFNNGSLMVDNKFLLENGNFCLEYVLEQTGRSASIITCPEFVPQVRIYHPSQNMIDIRFTLYPIGLAISAIFLAASLAAGTLLPASHHVLHWRCQTNHVACLLVGDVLLCITHLSGRIAFVPCFIIAVAMLFLFLSAFFWLNTMCFNIWWTFRDLRPQSTEKSQERLRLRLYEVYAWGIPLLITIIAASLDLSSDPSSDVIRPRFAEHNCWFSGDIEKLTYFFGPIGILLFINLLLFALTARELTCGLWKRELVKSTTERAALGRVCLKLVVVMGVSWIADLISFAVGGPQEVWYLTDIINSIHGVFIFIVVGCQPQVLSAVKRFWCVKRKHRQKGVAGTTNHHSTSSQGPPSIGDTLTNTNSVVTNGTTKMVPLETSC